MPTDAERSLALFPGGSLGEYDLPPGDVLVLARGEGARVWDTAGRELVDFTMGWGSVLLGHAHPAVVAAVRRQIESGSNFAVVGEPALRLAEGWRGPSPAPSASASAPRGRRPWPTPPASRAPSRDGPGS